MFTKKLFSSVRLNHKLKPIPNFISLGKKTKTCLLYSREWKCETVIQVATKQFLFSFFFLGLVRLCFWMSCNYVFNYFSVQKWQLQLQWLLSCSFNGRIKKWKKEKLAWLPSEPTGLRMIAWGILLLYVKFSLICFNGHFIDPILLSLSLSSVAASCSFQILACLWMMPRLMKSTTEKKNLMLLSRR